MPESSGISQDEDQAQTQPEGVYGTPQQLLGSPTQHDPVYQQQWVLQTPDRSELQASWLSEAEPEAAAELNPRWVLLEPNW